MTHSSSLSGSRQKYIAANKLLFVDLEKAFDCVPWKIIWRTLRKLVGVELWIVQLDLSRVYDFNNRNLVITAKL